jgi:glycosyltransferase involved in cell wall biosynthesis
MTADAVGGVWPYALDLARGLARHGVAVDLAVMGPPPGAAQREDADRAGVSLLEGPYRVEWMDDPWADVDAAAGWLLDLERAFEPDIVHLNGFCHGSLPWRAPVLVTGHSCVRSWWRAVQGEEAPAQWNEYSVRVRAGVRAATIVATPTTAMLAALDREYGPLQRERVIPNGRDFLRADAPREPIVFAAGRLWDAAKNIQALAAAARGISWPVYVAGDDRAPDGSPAWPGCVRRLGRLDAADVRAWYARASIYALPARYEPFGLSVLEAAISGCALVLGDIRSLRENWTGAALFVPPDDPGSIASAIQALIDNKPLRAEMGRRAEGRARQFTVERMVDGYLSAYDEALRVRGERLDVASSEVRR